ncbi:hypothetical protein AgCh_040399 [Apium graveolens]
MTKRQWIKSIFSSHIDPETDQELKGTKIETEGKIQKILKLIKDGNEDENSNKEPLVELIEDFHKQYQLLYDRYDHITGELRQKVHGKEKDSSSSSSSDSDSDKSHRIKSSKNGKRHDGIRHELESAKLEIVDLKSKLAAVSGENEALDSKYHGASIKLQEAEEEVKRCVAEGERLKHENTVILIDNKDLNVKLQCASDLEAQLNHQLEDVKNQMSILTSEKVAATSTIEEGRKVNDDLKAITAQLKDENEVLQLELDAAKGEVYIIKDNLQSAQQEIENLSQTLKITEEEKSSLYSKVVVLSEEIKQAHVKLQDLVTESSQLKEKLDSRETELLTCKEMHEAHLSEIDTRTRDLQLNLETLQTHKTEIEKQKDDELSALVMKLEDKERDFLSQIQHLTTEKSMLSEEIKQFQDTIQEMVSESSQMRDKLDGREAELLSHKETHEAYVCQTDARTRDLEQKLETLDLHKTEMEREKDNQLSALLMKIEDKEKDLLSQTEHLTAEKSMLSDEIKQLQDRMQELVTESSKLRETLDDKERDLSTLKGSHVSWEEEATNRIRNLELELESLQSEKHEIEKQKDLELSLLLTRLEDKERDALSQLELLKEDVNQLQFKVNDKQCELESLQGQILESNALLEKKDLEISGLLIQMESLKEDLSGKTANQLKLQEEKEGHMKLGKDLELQVDMAQNRIKELEDQLGEETNEIEQLRKANDDLKDKIAGLERTLLEREDQYSAVEKKLEEASLEASALIDASAIEINKLQQELESLHAENIELVRKIKEQEGMLKEQEVAFSELTEVHKQLEVSLIECKEKLQDAERKIEEMTKEFHNSMESNTQKFNELEEIFKEVERELEIKRDELEESIENLKRELDMKGDEVSTLTENVRNIEVKLRLSNQKLRITEQVLSEKENEHNVKEEKYQKDNKVLHERIIVLSGVLRAYKEDQFKMKAEFAEKLNQTFTGLDSLTRKLEEDSGHIETCVFEILNELHVAKNWVRDKNSNEENQKKKIANLIFELNSARQQEALLREQIENLVKAVKQLEVRTEESNIEKDKKIGEMEKRLKEKEEWILGIGEEKKEAIRQLCIWNDYHRERCVYLEKIITNRIGGRRQLRT